MKKLRAIIGIASLLAALTWFGADPADAARHRSGRWQPRHRRALLYRPISYRGNDREGKPLKQASAPRLAIATAPRMAELRQREAIRSFTPQDDADRQSRSGVRYLGEFIQPPANADRFGREGRRLSQKDLLDLHYMGWPQSYRDMRGRFGFPTYQTALEDYYELPNSRWLRIPYSRQGQATGADIGS